MTQLYVRVPFGFQFPYSDRDSPMNFKPPFFLFFRILSPEPP